MQKKIYCMRPSKMANCNAAVIKGHNYLPVVCNVDPQHNTTRPVYGPITIDLKESGTTECLWSWMSDCLLSGAVVEELRSAGFTGFSTDLVNAIGESPLGFHYVQFRATGWGGIAKPTSGIELIYRCDGCLRLRYSALLRPDCLFDQRQWDGSDIFIIWPMPMFKFITGRVAELFRDLKVKGVELVPIEELDTGKDGFGPGRLSYSLPPERANCIGKPLGIE